MDANPDEADTHQADPHEADPHQADPHQADPASSATAWFVLRHRPGPSLADGASIFATPAFAEHLAFLNRLRESGYLVAAGPLDAAVGEGLTVVRVPADGSVDVLALATTDDRSVAEGYLTVEVQHWDVRFTG